MQNKQSDCNIDKLIQTLVLKSNSKPMWITSNEDFITKSGAVPHLSLIGVLGCPRAAAANKSVCERMDRRRRDRDDGDLRRRGDDRYDDDAGTPRRERYPRRKKRRSRSQSPVASRLRHRQQQQYASSPARSRRGRRNERSPRPRSRSRSRSHSRRRGGAPLLESSVSASHSKL